ncbi:MAG: arginine--tRNA ligase, partial [Armatimonadetes bacterium]|nr:arginine--tRNA ligase [Armatimonadota bacterium]
MPTQTSSMQSPKQVLEQRVADALRAAYPDIAAEGELVVPTQSAEHGDYQCNRALQMAKAAKSNPRAVAQAVVGALQVADMCSAVEIAGPGFINFRLSPEWLGNAVAARLADERLGVARAVPVRTYVVDFSSPNVAKPMHVGHIRSTVLGDVLVRVLRFLGHDVVGDNHLGDWGTQFGMMILGYRDYVDQDALARDPIGELKRIYQAVVERAKTDEAYAEKARAELAKLQAGDPENLALWQEFIALSRQVFERIYRRLDISFDCWHGESFYNDMLAGVVQDLLDKGIARHDQGAAVIFFEAAEELRDKPFIIQKKDGAYLYSSSDLAAIKFRTESMHPDAMIYVVDGRQQLHFKQLFAAARLWGYRDVELQH